MYPDRFENVKNRQLSNRQETGSDTSVIHILDIEIDDHGVNACRSGICEHRMEEIQLLQYNEIPEFLKGNPWVIKGYRAFLPFGLCMKRYIICKIVKDFLILKTFQFDLCYIKPGDMRGAFRNLSLE